MLFEKESKYEMDMDTANTALQNILAACDKAPNTIPFDKILLRQEANIKPYNRLIIITAVLMLLTFLSPLMIVPLATQFDRAFAPEPVRLVDDYIEENILYLQFTGDNICYQNAYIEYPEGNRVPPVIVDEKKQLIGFPFDGTAEINIYIPLEDETNVHYLLTPTNQ